MFALFSILVFASSGRVLAATAGRLMPGQPHAVPANSTEVLAAARFAVFELNRVSPEEQFEIVNITSAKIQLVAGINYILEVQLGRTTCTLGKPCDLTSSKKLQCNFVVTEIPWKDSRELTKKKCSLHDD
ncbi:cystatin-like [Paralichthys olivaceus]|uniref:cystatin-like n=1 Tax=Paralichthys olivaceus TaxID=8255 RepID=UPI00097DA76D|nr:PREDICTED: cystatin-like [Paralichthys olivaceus]